MLGFCFLGKSYWSLGTEQILLYVSVLHGVGPLTW